MRDIFDDKGISPMLIAQLKEPFNDPDWIYELKLDGIRGLAYVNETVEFRNKRDKSMNLCFPELLNICDYVNEKCILDGEFIVFRDSSPSFRDIQKRALTTNPLKISLAVNSLPASFVAYDIIYYKDHLVVDLPIEERKKLLASVITESERLALSRFVPEKGIELFELAKNKHLEGVVAKRLGSKYYFGKRSKDWIKFKLLEDEDYVVCGYIFKENNMTSFVLGQYDNGILVYKGHVTLGVSIRKLEPYGPQEIAESPFSHLPSGNENAVWLNPVIVCTVEYMPRNDGSKNQPVLKAIRNDKSADECVVH